MKKDIRFEIKTVTPEMAKSLLERNGVNRRLSSQANSIARDILAGNYQLNGECIKIYADGTLADGQHRLNAVIIAGIPVQMCFCYNVPREVTIFDRGRKRSETDSLIIAGMDPKLACGFNVAIAKLILYIEESLSVFSSNEIESFLKDNSEGLLAVNSLTHTAKMKEEINTHCAPFGAALLYALNSGISEEVLNKFEYIVRKGFASNDNESAAIVCRNNLLSKTINVGGGAQDRKRAVFQISKAIKDFSNREPRKRTYAKWEDKVFQDYKKAAPTA